MSMDLFIRYGQSTLVVVPAIPFRNEFARNVNELCRDVQPDAIAVELGPETANACRSWIEELIEFLKSPEEFPCLLALSKKNILIRKTQENFKLSQNIQKSRGMKLSDLSVDELNILFNYSSQSVTFLSPVDSIIEAIRCSIELNIPLYGIDIEECADSIRKETIIKDQLTFSLEGLKSFISDNFSQAEYSRDPIIDERREKVIASRIKYLLNKHKKVLYTGGIQRWRNIYKQINDKDEKPANQIFYNKNNTTHFTRCIVHPLIGLHFTDRYPQFVATYNNLRPTLNKKKYNNSIVNSWKSYTPLEISNDLIKGAYNSYFCAKNGENIDERYTDFQRLNNFERLVNNLCLLNNTLIPDIFILMEAGLSTMSEYFCKSLAKKLMKLNWTSNKTFQNLPVLTPIELNSNSNIKCEFISPDGKRSHPFYLNCPQVFTTLRSDISIPWEWGDDIFKQSKQKSYLPQSALDNKENDPSFQKGDLRTWVSSRSCTG